MEKHFILFVVWTCSLIWKNFASYDFGLWYYRRKEQRSGIKIVFIFINFQCLVDNGIHFKTF